MKKILALILVVSCCAGIASASTKDWRTRYSSMLQSLRGRNLDAFKSGFSEDFTTTDPKGETQKRSDFFAMLDQMFANAKTVRTNIKVLKSTETATTAEVSYDFHLRVLGVGGKGTSVHEIGTDSWKKVGSKWLCYKTIDQQLEVKPIGKAHK